MKKLNHFILFLLVFFVLSAGTVQARTSSWQKALIVGTLLHVLLPQPQVVVAAPAPAVVYPAPVVVSPPVVVAPSPVVVYPRTRVVAAPTRVICPPAPSHHRRHRVASPGHRPGSYQAPQRHVPQRHVPQRHATSVYGRTPNGRRNR